MTRSTSDPLDDGAWPVLVFAFVALLMLVGVATVLELGRHGSMSTLCCHVRNRQALDLATMREIVGEFTTDVIEAARTTGAILQTRS